MLFQNSPDKVLKKAKEFSTKGRIDKAIEKLEKSIPEYPKSFEIIWELITLYRKVENIDEINKQIKKVLQSFPDKKDVALKFLEENFFELPFNKEMASMLAQIYLASRDLTATNNVLNRFPDKSIKEEIAEQTKKMEEMETTFRTSNIPYSFKFISLLYYLALLEKKSGNDKAYIEILTKVAKSSNEEVDTIVSEFKRAMYSDKQNIEYRLALARIHIDLKMPKDAIEELNLALQMKPQMSEAILEIMDKGLKDNPDDSNLRLGYAHLAMMSGKNELALPTMKKLVQEQPHLGNQVIERLRQRLRSDPQNSSLRLALAEIYISLGQTASAIQEVEIAHHNQSPDQVDALIPILKDIIGLDPKNINALFMLADAYINSGKIDESISIFEQAIRRDSSLEQIITSKLNYIIEVQPDNYPIRIALVHLYMNLKAFDAAQNILNNIPSGIPSKYLNDVVKIYQDMLHVGSTSRAIMVNLAQILLTHEQYQDLPPVLLSMERKYPEEIHIFLRQIIQIIPHKPEIISFFRSFLEKYYERNPDDDTVQSILLHDYASRKDYEKLVGFIEMLSMQENGVPHNVYSFLKEIVLKDDTDYTPAKLLFVKLASNAGQIDTIMQLYKKLKTDTSNYFELAKEMLNSILHKQPQNQEARIALMKLYFNDEIYDVCIDLGYKMLTSKEDVEVRTIYSLSLTKQREWEKALQSIRQLPSQGFAEKIKILEEIERLTPGHIEVLEELVKVMASSGQIDNAAQHIVDFLELQPANSLRLKVIADELLRNHPENAMGYYLRGRFLTLENQNKEAIESLQKSMELNSQLSSKVLPLLINLSQNIKGDHQIKINMALLHIREKSYDEAILDLKEAYKIAPKVIQQIYEKVEDILKYTPNNIDANYFLSDLSLSLEIPEKAVSTLETISKTVTEGEVDRLISHYEQTFKKFGENKVVLRSYAHFLFSLSRRDDAVDTLKELIKIDNNEVFGFKKDIEDLGRKTSLKQTETDFCRFILAFCEKDRAKAAELGLGLFDFTEYKDIVYSSLINLSMDESIFNLDLSFCIARLQIRKEEYDLAQETLDYAFKQSSGYPKNQKKIKVELISLYHKTKRDTEALNLLSEIDDGDASVYKSIQQSITETIKSSVIDLKERLKTVSSTEGFDIRLELSKFLVFLNRPREALTYLQIHGWPTGKQKERQYYLAQVFLKIGDYFDAIAILTEYLPRDSHYESIAEENIPMLRSLFQAYIGLGNLSAAATILSIQILRTGAFNYENLVKQRRLILDQLEQQRLRRNIALIVK